MRLRLLLPLAFVLLFALPNLLNAQTATLKEIHADGLKKLTEAQVISLSGLATGAQVGRTELQDAADALVRSGLFAKVNYNFTTHNDAVSLTFHLEENPRLPVSYDSFPWFADSELDDAVRKDLPFYDGTLPEGGAVVEQAANSLQAFLAAHGSNVQIEHAVLLNPLNEGSVHQFRVEGLALRIASMEFSDAHLKESLAVQQHLPEILGKPYSRLAIASPGTPTRNCQSKSRCTCRASRGPSITGTAWSGAATRRSPPSRSPARWDLSPVMWPTAWALKRDGTASAKSTASAAIWK